MRKIMLPQPRQRLLVVLGLLLLVCLLIFFAVRGITYYDEGYILNAALRTIHGQIPYRDFDMVYTPLSFVITAGFLKLFGVSVFAGRLAALFISFLSLTALVCLLKQFVKDQYVLLASLLLFVSWGPAHVNFPWPTMFAICCLLYAALWFLQGLKRGSRWLMFLSGLVTVLVFLAKQNYGAGVLGVLVLAFWFTPLLQRKRLLLGYLSGVIAAAATFIAVLFFTGSFVPFLQNMYLYTFKRIVLDQALSTPFLYDGSWVVRSAKFMLYTAPVSIAVGALLLTWKTDRQLVLLPLLTLVFYLLGIRPTTDYVHLSPLLALACVPLALIIALANKAYVQYIAIVVLLVLAGMGFYSAYFKGYYQWEPSVADSTAYAAADRLHIYLTAGQRCDAQALIDYLQKNTRPNEPIFVDYYAPLVYFLADRPNVTPYDLISTNQLPPAYQANVIRSLREKHTQIVVMHEINRSEDTSVSNYVRANYTVERVTGGFLLMRRIATAH